MTTRRALMTAAALLVLLTFTALPLLAQPRQGGPGPHPDREDLQETIEIYMMAKMKRYLELDEEQSRTVIPIVEGLNSARREFRRERRGMLRQLQPHIEDSTRDPDDVVDLLESLYALERNHREDETAAIDSIRASLSPVQQARFMLFQERFRREIEQRLRGMMRERRGGPPRQRPRGGGD